MVEQRVHDGVEGWGLAMSVNRKVRRGCSMGFTDVGRTEGRLKLVLYSSTTEEPGEFVLEKDGERRSVHCSSLLQVIILLRLLTI